MRITSRKGNTFNRQPHIPSGIILVWLGRDDNKIHTQSIAIQYPLWGKERSWKMTLKHAQTELYLRQISQMRLGDIGHIPTKFEPMVTKGLTGAEAKNTMLKELQRQSNLLNCHPKIAGIGTKTERKCGRHLPPHTKKG